MSSRGCPSVGDRYRCGRRSLTGHENPIFQRAGSAVAQRRPLEQLSGGALSGFRQWHQSMEYRELIIEMVCRIGDPDVSLRGARPLVIACVP